jgi:hypothetical protein
MRTTGDRVTVRQRTRDVEILNEIFSHRNYEPPAETTRALRDQSLRILDLRVVRAIPMGGGTDRLV